MGFTTGFFGGLTFTYSLLYLSIHLHRSNRQHQSLLLTQQRGLLTSLYEPQAIIIESPAYEVRQAGLTEQLKDGWNRELGNMIRHLQEKDWEAARIKWETRASNLWHNLKNTEAGKEVAERLSENVIGKAEDAKDTAKKATGEKRLLEI